MIEYTHIVDENKDFATANDTLTATNQITSSPFVQETESGTSKFLLSESPREDSR